MKIDNLLYIKLSLNILIFMRRNTLFTFHQTRRYYCGLDKIDCKQRIVLKKAEKWAVDREKVNTTRIYDVMAEHLKIVRLYNIHREHFCQQQYSIGLWDLNVIYLDFYIIC